MFVKILIVLLITTLFFWWLYLYNTKEDEKDYQKSLKKFEELQKWKRDFPEEYEKWLENGRPDLFIYPSKKND